MEITQENDPGRWGHSLGNAAEILTKTLEVADVKSVTEVGAYAGDLTRELLEWATPKGIKVTAVDPTPAPELAKLTDEYSELTVVHETSIEALGHIDIPDGVIIDGDHNYFTVSEELRVVHERSEDGSLPLLLFHDVCWPHARRNTYYGPERIPEEHKKNLAEGVQVFPGESGFTHGGLPYKWASSVEGGPENGVLTAVEDYVAAHEDLTFAIVPVFFGFGIVWSKDAPYASALAEYLAPYDRNPVLTRLEENRVFHLANEHVRKTELWQLEMRTNEQQELLKSLLESKAFEVADRASHLKSKGGVSWREQIRRVLDES